MPEDTDQMPGSDDASAEANSAAVADDPGGDSLDAGEQTGSSGRPPLAVTIVLAVAVVALAVVVALVLRDRADLQATADRQADIAAAVADFGHAVLTYDHADIDATVDAVNELVTDRMRDELATGYLGLLRAQIEALEATSVADVIDVLVSETSGDTARAIAVIDTNVASTTTRAQVTAYLEVSLLRVDGTWLANEMRALSTEGGLVDDDGNPIGSMPGVEDSDGPATIPDEPE